MKYTVEVNEVGDVFWYKEGTKTLHRENGLPAIEFSCGGKAWWVDGQRHRANGLPAIEWVAGGKQWWVDGVLGDIPEVYKAELAVINGAEYELIRK